MTLKALCLGPVTKNGINAFFFDLMKDLYINIKIVSFHLYCRDILKLK